MYIQIGTCSQRLFFFLLRTCVRENKFCFHRQLHEPIYKLRASFGNISIRAKNPKFLVDQCFLSKGLMPSAPTQLVRVLPVIKMSHLRLHKWLLLLCSMASISGKKGFMQFHGNSPNMFEISAEGLDVFWCAVFSMSPCFHNTRL